MRILLVDGDQSLVKSLVLKARSAGDVELIPSGSMRDARRLLAVEPIDAVVADEFLPDGRGTELLAEVASLRPSTGRILTTAMQDMRIAERATEVEVDRLLVKAFQAGELWCSARSAVEKRRDEARLRKLDLLLREVATESDGYRNALRIAIPARELARLTLAERDVLSRMTAGQVCKEIAADRCVATSTTREQISAVYAKLEVRSRAELMRKCRGWR